LDNFDYSGGHRNDYGPKFSIAVLFLDADARLFRASAKQAGVN